MFRNLRASTTLIILSGAFIISIAATSYSLFAEKRIAIEFARKELVGSRYLETVRSVYATVLPARPFDLASAGSSRSTDDLFKALATPQDNAGGAVHTNEAAEALVGALRLLSRTAEGGAASSFALDVLAKARALVSRIADKTSNLAFDPDLDSYYVQDLVTRLLPTFLQYLGDMQLASRAAPTAGASDEHKVRSQVLEGLLRSTTDEVRDNLAAAYRRNPDGRLRRAIEGPFANMLSSTNAYLGGLNAPPGSPHDRLYGIVVANAMGAWTAAQSELDRLLNKRIDGLTARLRWTMALTGALAAFSIGIAVMTHRHIVRPLERLEIAASTVRKTKDYDVRIDYAGKNELGRLAAALNDMLAELAAARDRERSEQLELARTARLTTMGALTASIAHEINQPLAAIAANSNAASRWLSNAPPDLGEARVALKNIVSDSHRASQVIGSVRTMFRTSRACAATCCASSVASTKREPSSSARRG